VSRGQTPGPAQPGWEEEGGREGWGKRKGIWIEGKGGRKEGEGRGEGRGSPPGNPLPTPKPKIRH